MKNYNVYCMKASLDVIYNIDEMPVYEGPSSYSQLTDYIITEEKILKGNIFYIVHKNFEGEVCNIEDHIEQSESVSIDEIKLYSDHSTSSSKTFHMKYEYLSFLLLEGMVTIEWTKIMSFEELYRGGLDENSVVKTLFDVKN